MRTHQLAAIALCLMLAGASVLAAEKYGKGVTIETATPITQLLSRASEFAGKTVRVEGVVTEVCTMMGCWMALAPADNPKSTMMIKVEDGVIVFPVSAKGKRASAEGVVQRIGNDHEAQEAAAEHAAGTHAEQPVQWQIKATGALVY